MIEPVIVAIDVPHDVEEVVDSEAPTRIVEVNVAAKAKRTGQGTYTLTPLPGGGTHITFEYRWLVAPTLDRLTKPIARAYIKRNNTSAMRRLAEQPEVEAVVRVCRAATKALGQAFARHDLRVVPGSAVL